MNLSREYERLKIERAKTLEGQKEDLAKVNGAFTD